MKERNLIKVARIAAITETDLLDRSTTPLFRDAIKEEIYWSPVSVAETSEPHVTLTVKLPGAGLVFGVINLTSLLNFAREFKLSYDGRAYVVDQVGRLISAADVSLVLRQTMLADRPLIRQLIDPIKAHDLSFVEGNYISVTGASMVATGLRIAKPQWAVVIEQPESLLFAPISQKIWFFLSLSLIGLISSFVLAQRLKPAFHKTYHHDCAKAPSRSVAATSNIESRLRRDDEIGELATQFNLMADHLRSSQQATLSALTIPIISQTSELKEVLTEVAAKIMRLTGSQAASIRLINDGNSQFSFSVYRGFFRSLHARNNRRCWSTEPKSKKLSNPASRFFQAICKITSSSNRNTLAREGFDAAVYLPLKTTRKTFGIMTVASRERGGLTSKQADIFTAITHQISIALQNARLFQDTERNLERIARFARYRFGYQLELESRSGTA